jgi:hypothetical protein
VACTCVVGCGTMLDCGEEENEFSASMNQDSSKQVEKIVSH